MIPHPCRRARGLDRRTSLAEAVKTWIALLRGINVGGKTTLDMKALAKIMDAAGYTDIRWYIRSGNIVFRHVKIPTRNDAGLLSAAIQAGFGITPHILFLSPADLQQALDNNPYSVDEGKALHFHFLDGVPENPDLAVLDAVRKESESWALIGEVFYLHAPEGVARSKLAAKVEKALGVPATARNLNTVMKLHEMVTAG